MQLKIEIDTGAGPDTITLKGRTAWALQTLRDAGEKGVTPITHPAPRWSSYVHKLRRKGITIDTIQEPHSGDFAGYHARYRLASPVKVVDGAQ